MQKLKVEKDLGFIRNSSSLLFPKTKMKKPVRRMVRTGFITQ